MIDRVLTYAQMQAGLVGAPPEPFRRGRRLELLMDNGRLVRGDVVRAGGQVAQLQVGFIPTWRDAKGNERPGYPHMNLIVYAQIVRWRYPKEGATTGTWMPDHPRRKAALAQSGGKWADWRWPQ